MSRDSDVLTNDSNLRYNENELEIDTEKLRKLNELLDRADAYSKFLLEEEEKMRIRSVEDQRGQITNKWRNDIEKDSASEFEVPLLMGGELKDYQIDGIRWLINLFNNGLSGILADEMGLGKTVQVIGMLAVLRERGVKGPFLVCAPLSTLHNWISEIKKWCPTLNCVMYHGPKSSRKKLVNDVMAPSRSRENQFPIVITSYEMCISDRLILAKYDWKYLIVDEGHRIKNRDCLLIRNLKLLNSESRLLLSGTPIQNTLEELWSLLNFVNPNIFSDLHLFRSWFNFKNIGTDVSVDKIIAEEEQKMIVSRLHEILRPFFLRRLKADVLANVIPPKKEIILYAGMSALQQSYYYLIESGSLRKVLMELNVENAKDISQANMIMNLRKVCQHPFLFGEIKNEDGNYVGTENPQKLIEASGKLKLFDRLMMKLMCQDHKILVYSQMTSMISILEDYFIYRNIIYLRLDGSTRIEDRQSRINEFNRSGSMSRVFLLSTRAGGLGINLTAADTVVIYDSDWNPHQDIQAGDRCHRIGQNSNIVIYRLLTLGSIEIDMMERQMSKKKLERMTVIGGDFRKVGKRCRGSFTSKTLRDLLSDEISNLRQRAIRVNTESTDPESKYHHSNYEMVEISEEELCTIVNRQLIFGDIESGNCIYGVSQDFKLNGNMYDVVEDVAKSIIDINQ